MIITDLVTASKVPASYNLMWDQLTLCHSCDLCISLMTVQFVSAIGVIYDKFTDGSYRDVCCKDPSHIIYTLCEIVYILLCMVNIYHAVYFYKLTVGTVLCSHTVRY